MTTNYKIGDRVKIYGFVDTTGVIKDIKGNKLFILKRLTTTGNLTQFSLRNDNTFVAVGYSKDDSSWGGWIKN